MAGPGAEASRTVAYDVARGLAVLFVVVFHAMLFAEAAEAWSRPWRGVVGLFRLLPVPLLLLLSGFFARQLLTSTPRTLRRCGAVLALYVVATTAFVLVFWRLGYPRRDTATVFEPGALLHELLLPTTYLWYLYALVVLLAVARATHRLPALPLLLAATALSVLAMSGAVSTGSAQVDDLLGFAVFLLVGARAPQLVERVRLSAGTRTGVLVVVGYLASGVLTVAAVVAGWTTTWRLDSVPVLGTATAALSVAAGLCLADLLARTPLRHPLALLGRWTLPVYMGHEPVLGVLTTWAGPFLAGTSGVARHGVVLVLLAVGIAVPVAVVRALRVVTRGRRAGAAAARTTPPGTGPARDGPGDAAHGRRARPVTGGPSGSPRPPTRPGRG